MHQISQAALSWLLEKTNSQALAHLLRRWPALCSAWEKGGFKLTPQTFENQTQRARLQSILLLKEAPTEVFLLDVADLKGWLPLREAWEALSPQWLEQHWRDFLQSVPDPRPWCMAVIWWGKSDKLQRLASLLLLCRKVWQDPPGERPPGPLAPMLQCFSSPAKVRAAKDNRLEQQQAWQEKFSALKPQLEQLRRENQELQRQLSDEQARNRNALKQQQRASEAREQKLQADLAAICASSEAKTRAALDNFQQMCLGIHPDLEAFSTSLAQTNAGLAERLEAVLQKQAGTNRLYGLKRELRAEAERLEGYLQQVRLAIDEAIVICPELPALQKELENLLAQVYAKLQEDPDKLALAVIPTRLKALIMTISLDAEAQTKFAALRDFLEQEFIGQLLLPDETEAVRALLDKRCRLQLEAESRSAVERARFLPHSHTQLIWSLAAFVNDLHRVVLYVDAYNVIIGDNAWKAVKDKKGLLQVRREFLDRVRVKAGIFKQVHLVYDSGNALSSVETAGKVSVHFAPSLREDQGADDYIVKMLRENPREEQTLRWVVTDDEGLQNRSKEFCDGIVAGFCLNQFLRLT
ncbi:MAG: hypothetical protein GX564_04810 [Oligosphaeraceae bacterium]|nr:hypothetical protein [Oligosphaeraceae bacterium]